MRALVSAEFGCVRVCSCEIRHQEKDEEVEECALSLSPVFWGYNECTRLFSRGAVRLGGVRDD